MDQLPYVLITNFNSIKVRLEHLYEVEAGCLVEFQFHKGTIRTLYPTRICLDTSLFQFHKGTIRTVLLTGKITVLSLFQFHKGTIRTPLKLRQKSPYIQWVCECKDTKKSSEKCRCLKIFFLRPYDNLPIYGGFNKSKSTFGGFA